MPFDNSINKAIFSPSNDYLIVLNSNGELEYYKSDGITSDRLKHQFKNKGSKVIHFAVDWVTHKVAVAWDDNTVKI